MMFGKEEFKGIFAGIAGIAIEERYGPEHGQPIAGGMFFHTNRDTC